MALDINVLLSAQLHDLKNQMQALLNAQSELEDALNLTDEQQSLLEKLRNHSGHLSQRVVELLSVLKMQNQSFKPNIEECWLSDTLNPIVQEFFELHGLNITLDFDDDFNQFYDEQLVHIAVHNACMNAFQAGATTLRIHIDELEQGCWQLLIEDNGPGFPHEQLNDDNAFTPNGTQNGLGLYLIEQAMHAHKRNQAHGEVRLQNRQHGGAQVTLIFP